MEASTYPYIRDTTFEFRFLLYSPTSVQILICSINVFNKYILTRNAYPLRIAIISTEFDTVLPLRIL